VEHAVILWLCILFVPYLTTLDLATILATDSKAPERICHSESLFGAGKPFSLYQATMRTPHYYCKPKIMLSKIRSPDKRSDNVQTQIKHRSAISCRNDQTSMSPAVNDHGPDILPRKQDMVYIVPRVGGLLTNGDPAIKSIEGVLR
jgi:hypothetical protein